MSFIQLYAMRYFIVILAGVLVSCGGSLSDEQRKKLREGVALHEIKKVSELEITEAALEKGRSIVKTMEGGTDKVDLDSLMASTGSTIKFLTPGAHALEIEKQLIDAYVAAEPGSQVENLQPIRKADGTVDSLLYTQPKLSKQPDGTDKLEGVWNIWLSQKEIVLSITKN